MPESEVQSSFVSRDAASSSECEPTLPAADSSDPETNERLFGQSIPAELASHPRYRIQKRLGIGGMGTVYLAEHRLMDRSVALKVIRRDLLGNDALVERFRREVKAAARLALHPNIVAAYDAEHAGDFHFLVMEFVDGSDLARLVKSQGPMPCALACETVKQAAEGLEHAFQSGMVHRDIKPQNLMRTPDGQVKILDFGLARFASEALPDLVPASGRETGSGIEASGHDHAFPITLTDMVLGTADYIAPERASAPRSADIRADIYSLGCTFYYLLAGHPPFPQGTLVQKLQAHGEQLPAPLSTVRPDVPPGLARIVDRMMAKDRNTRFQRPSDVAAALAPYADSKAAGEAHDHGASKEDTTRSAAALLNLTWTEDLNTLDESSSMPQLDNPDTRGTFTPLETLPQPSSKSRTRVPGARVSTLVLPALLIASVWLFWAQGRLPATATPLPTDRICGFFRDGRGWLACDLALLPVDRDCRVYPPGPTGVALGRSSRPPPELRVGPGNDHSSPVRVRAPLPILRLCRVVLLGDDDCLAFDVAYLPTHRFCRATWNRHLPPTGCTGSGEKVLGLGLPGHAVRCLWGRGLLCGGLLRRPR